ncbi:hypothetical protein KIN20_001131 [Parelaphostrongylus tenuis]|uniref:Uncharacterized protein n=1 Tax=Parelaphostrongylus tenuis TaxID=148309 RepID=A0AAD5LTM9_PARTN|nr:hypothetical protein KIN20_001131 [Parelaphostrongylus tenuis]
MAQIPLPPDVHHLIAHSSTSSDDFVSGTPRVNIRSNETKTYLLLRCIEHKNHVLDRLREAKDCPCVLTV